MPKAIDGSIVPKYLTPMACGGVPVFAEESGFAYRCDMCFCVIGSVSQPQQCKELQMVVDKFKLENQK